jgi:glycosyltransferase involved in cell wall biosynthesis
MILLLIGDGPLRHEIEQATALMGLNDNVVFAGLRSDVPQLMLKVMDTFIFPSLYEGLGLALVEAQAAGLPCVLSDVIPAEADIVKPLLKRISLSQPASQWAEELLDHRQASFTISQSSALTLVKESPLNIETSLKQLTGIYQAQFERKIQHEF